MKFRYSLFYPLSFVLAATFSQSSYGQGVEDAPVEVVGEDLNKVSEEADLTVDAARQQLEAAKLVLETAPDGEKEQAIAEVEAAQSRLDVAVGKGEIGRDRESRRDRRNKPDSSRNEAEEQGDSKTSNAKDETNGTGMKRTTEGSADEIPPEPGVIPEESKRNGRPGMKEERAGEPGAKKAAQAERTETVNKDTPTPAAESSEEIEKMEPVAEKPPEANVETKREAVEAKEADKAVDLTTKMVEEQADKKKLNIKDKGEARNLIRDLIGAESEVSKAEANRETRLESRFRRDDRHTRDGGNRDEIRGASDFLLRQLTGRAQAEEAPEFFRRPAVSQPLRDGRNASRNPMPHKFEVAPPRYYHEGRRYVRFDSRNSIPAILLAAAALERVSVLPANRTDGYFPEEEGRNNYANDLPPENYRGADAVVVSYPVSASSMISSNDIIFAQGSTRFADAHSYDMVMALGNAMANPALKDARFVIEGHASAEGSYEGNMALSQRRAEAIVRDMVREGIDPERLIPVGYGESEARFPADAAERLRSQDRNVRVFRIDGKS